MTYEKENSEKKGEQTPPPTNTKTQQTKESDRVQAEKKTDQNQKTETSQTKRGVTYNHPQRESEDTERSQKDIDQEIHQKIPASQPQVFGKNQSDDKMDKTDRV